MPKMTAFKAKNSGLSNHNFWMVSAAASGGHPKPRLLSILMAVITSYCVSHSCEISDFISRKHDSPIVEDSPSSLPA